MSDLPTAESVLRVLRPILSMAWGHKPGLLSPEKEKVHFEGLNSVLKTTVEEAFSPTDIGGNEFPVRPGQVWVHRTRGKSYRVTGTGFSLEGERYVIYTDSAGHILVSLLADFSNGQFTYVTQPDLCSG